MEPLIRVQNLMKIYNPGENEVRALDDVSLDIGQGEFVAIIGQSGSGKSTFMNMLGCLDVPTSGHYYLNGKDVSSLSDDELSEIRNQEIGFIFQGFNLIQNLTAQWCFFCLQCVFHCFVHVIGKEMIRLDAHVFYIFCDCIYIDRSHLYPPGDMEFFRTLCSCSKKPVLFYFTLFQDDIQVFFAVV